MNSLKRDGHNKNVCKICVQSYSVHGGFINVNIISLKFLCLFFRLSIGLPVTNSFVVPSTTLLFLGQVISFFKFSVPDLRVPKTQGVKTSTRTPRRTPTPRSPLGYLGRLFCTSGEREDLLQGRDYFCVSFDGDTLFFVDRQCGVPTLLKSSSSIFCTKH